MTSTSINNEGGETESGVAADHSHDIWPLEKIENHMKMLTSESPKRE